MQMCQTFQLESRKQFIQLKFVETQLGTGSNSSDSRVNLGFSQLIFPKVMFSQVIVSSSSRLNTAFPSYILLEVPSYKSYILLEVTSYKLYFVGYTFQDYTLLIKNLTVELNTKHCHHD